MFCDASTKSTDTIIVNGSMCTWKNRIFLVKFDI